MTSAMRAVTVSVTLAVAFTCAQLTAPMAFADEELHNITYRARVDGVARGAVITYKLDDTQIGSADPTMLPGRTFEANTVLADPKAAGMQVSIQLPYGANLHCEIYVDGAVVAQADQFIAPRLTRVKDDPLYGILPCGAPLSDGAGNIVNTGPVDGNIPVDPNAPADLAAPVDPAAPPPPS